MILCPHFLVAASRVLACSPFFSFVSSFSSLVNASALPLALRLLQAGDFFLGSLCSLTYVVLFLSSSTISGHKHIKIHTYS